MAWPSLSWYDRTTGQPVEITTASSLIEVDAEIRTSSTLPIQTISDVIHRYRLRPEHKSLGSDGERAGRESSGKLQRRPVRSVLALQQLIGKEGNKLLERQVGDVVHSDEYLADYGARKDAWHCVVDAVRQLGAGAVARRSGLDRRTIQRAVRKHPDPTTPHRANQTRITIAAAAEARERLAELGEAPPDGALPALVRYLEALNAP